MQLAERRYNRTPSARETVGSGLVLCAVLVVVVVHVRALKVRLMVSHR